MSTFWPAEHADAVRELCATAMSYVEMATAINERFKTSYSRNSVLSKATRMGLTKGPDAKEKKITQPNIRRLREVRSPNPDAAKADAAARPEQTPLRCVEIEPRHVSLVDLAPGDCRYPYGGDSDGEPITFCGHPRRAGAYCFPHFRLAHGPGTVSERAAGRIAEVAAA